MQSELPKAKAIGLQERVLNFSRAERFTTLLISPVALLSLAPRVVEGYNFDLRVVEYFTPGTVSPGNQQYSVWKVLFTAAQESGPLWGRRALSLSILVIENSLTAVIVPQNGNLRKFVLTR